MGKKKTIKYLMLRQLELHTRFGVSRHSEKTDNMGQSAYIHSSGTLRTYIQQATNYATYLTDRGLRYCTLDDAKRYAADYVLSKHSTWSQSTARSALAKVFGVSGPDICQLDRRDPTEIVRGRVATDRAAAIERNHPDLAAACRSMGLRSGKELRSLTAKDIRHGADGQLYAHVKGKGGRIRDALILPGRGRDIVLQRVSERPDGPLFDVPSNTNVHRWRADYAASCYQYALDHGHGSGSYYIPHDGSGSRWDKGALDYVSDQMGHGSDRYYTIYYDYLTYATENS